MRLAARVTRRPSARSGGLPLILAVLATATTAAAQIYTETFTAADGSAWPLPWFVVTPHVLSADILDDRARWNGQPQFVARMILPGFAETDVEAECTVEFENAGAQGFGFYARQNGGYLQDTAPFGQGYAMFLKGNWAWPEDLGLWHETNGVEQQFRFGLDPVAGGLQDGVPYRIRYRVTQDTPAQTLLQAKVWEAADPEPIAWTIEGTDATPELQGTAGSFAVDVYNHSGTASLYLDDLVIRRVGGASAAPTGAAAASPVRVEPNPFRASCRITVDGAAPALTEAVVYDALGRRRARVAPNGLGWTWDGTDDAGVPLPAGIYFLRTPAGPPGAARVVRLR